MMHETSELFYEDFKTEVDGPDLDQNTEPISLSEEAEHDLSFFDGLTFDVPDTANVVSERIGDDEFYALIIGDTVDESYDPYDDFTSDKEGSSSGVYSPNHRFDNDGNHSYDEKTFGDTGKLELNTSELKLSQGQEPPHDQQDNKIEERQPSRIQNTVELLLRGHMSEANWKNLIDHAEVQPLPDSLDEAS